MALYSEDADGIQDIRRINKLIRESAIKGCCIIDRDKYVPSGPDFPPP